MTSPTLSELVRLQQEADSCAAENDARDTWSTERLLEQAVREFNAAARNFDLKGLQTQYEAMREWIKYSDHNLDCAVEHWRQKWGVAIHPKEIPDCTCGLDALRASLDTKARGDGK